MSLPERPSLEYLKKLAKDRLPGLRRADPTARLADAQLAVAREHGFPSWRALRTRLTVLEATHGHERSWPAETIPTLFDAIKRGDEPAVQAMLTADPPLAQARDADGSTPLLQAAEWNQPGIVALLFARGADPQRPYAYSAHTPLSWALTTGALDAARALLRGGVEPDLFCAAGLGEVARVSAFFDADGRLRPGASRTGSSRYAADGTRLPCPPAPTEKSSLTRFTSPPVMVRTRSSRTCSPARPISASAPFWAAPRCTGPTGVAHARQWTSSSMRAPIPRPGTAFSGVRLGLSASASRRAGGGRQRCASAWTRTARWPVSSTAAARRCTRRRGRAMPRSWTSCWKPARIHASATGTARHRGT